MNALNFSAELRVELRSTKARVPEAYDDLKKTLTTGCRRRASIIEWRQRFQHSGRQGRHLRPDAPSSRLTTFETLLVNSDGTAWQRLLFGLNLMEAPVLAYFDTNKSIDVQCDARQVDLVAVFLQGGRPVE